MQFHGLPVVAVFDVVKGHSRRLRMEARRFKQVLQEFQGRQQMLRSVDLAFNKLAVIELR